MQSQAEAARQFYYKWNGKGKEDEDARSYWIDILVNIFGVDNVTDRVQFEKKVLGDKSKKRIDVYIPETHTLIEQKSLGIALDKPQQGHDGKTPYEQAKEYDNLLPYEERARWIVTSNFAEIWIYDMSVMKPDPIKIELAELQTKYHMLDFLIDKGVKKVTDEMRLSIKAGELVGKIHDRFLEQYHDPMAKKTQNSLNILCVRLVFCLYAEDAGLFGKHDAFRAYIAQYEPKDIRRALMDLFEVLNTPEDERAEMYLSDDLEAFPYVNGGLFQRENIVIPKITEEIKDVLLEASLFDWSHISPVIFGAVFESTLNPETRRAGGMHYTSIKNIHKVIDPLFLDDLTAELEEIKKIEVVNTRKKKLAVFQDKLARLRFLDPAAGSGNFLTETYICLRRLENEAIKLREWGQMSFGDVVNPIKVSITQFYGIEINDFAVTVARTALWIAESQAMQATEDIVHMNLDFLPLRTGAHIVEGNALRLDWNSVMEGQTPDYIMGNPPFVGYSFQSKEQKEDILSIYVDEKGKPYKTAGKIDYVAGWYWRASHYIQNSQIRVAFVSTNSITQGEQVASVWKPLYERFKIHIDFAYRTFIWDSEANQKAHVHCVIVGFSNSDFGRKKVLYIDDSSLIETNNINAYLYDAPDIFIENRKIPLADVPSMTTGNRPADGGYLIIEKDQYEDFITKDPESIRYIKRLVGSEEFINNRIRYCLWLVGVSPADIKKMPEVLKRVEGCRQDRLKGAPDRQKLADTPTLFRETKNPDTFIIVPKVSSERRRYVPMGFMNGDTISTDLNFIIPDTNLFIFGILESNVHMAWMRAVAGRLKSDYRYSRDIVYNNFPWPSPTPEQKETIEKTAQKILDARALYPDASLADLYDPLTMPTELRKAHAENDKAVMHAYGMPIKETDEAACVAWLMRLYQKKVNENVQK